MNNMKYVRDHYGVPAKQGGRIKYLGAIEGTILSARNGSLHILLDGYKNPAWFHPTWEIKYL